MGIEKTIQGFLTNKNPEYTLFKLVTGICKVPDTVSFESVPRPGHFLRHSSWDLWLHERSCTPLFLKDACFHPRYNKYFSGYVAYESVNYPGHFIRHQNYRLKINKDDGSRLFAMDASWKTTVVGVQVKPQVQSFFLNLYQSVVFISHNFPNHKIGIEKTDQGYLTKKYPELHNFKVVPGVSGVPETISLESTASPGHFLRHSGYLIYLHKYQNTDLYKKDASFYPRSNKYYVGFVSFESVNYPGFFIRHQGYRLKINRDDGSVLFKKDASWKSQLTKSPELQLYSDAMFESYNFPNHKMGIEKTIQGFLTNKNPEYTLFKLVTGICKVPDTVSFESVPRPGHFLRHSSWDLWLHERSCTPLFLKDACFHPRYNKYFSGYVAYESVNYPGHFIRHQNYRLKINKDDGSRLFAMDASWKTKF